MKLKLLSLITFTCASVTLCAQTTFEPKVTIDADTGDNPYTMATGLIDDDAFLDIMVGTDVDNTLIWYKNNGDATFTKQTNTSNTMSGVGGLKLVDLNNDTFLDILITAYNSDFVAWYANDGLGNFGAEQIIATVPGASGLFVADIDGNTTLDIAVTSYDNSQVVWFANNGSGVFGTSNTIDNTLVNPGSVNMKDIDGDGDLDALISTASYDGNDVIEIFRNDLIPGGTVAFTKDATSVATGKTGFFNATFEDLDGDSNLDILATEVSCGGCVVGNLYWYETDGAGYTETTFTTSIINPSIAQHQDIDGDTLKDIVLSSGTSNAGNDLVWFKNNGGTYGAEQVIDATQSQAFVYNLADYDADGDLDIASCAYNQDDLNYFSNNLIVLGTNDIESDNLAIYPNPAKNSLSFKDMTSESLNLQVFDVIGKSVINTTVLNNGSIDISALNSGLYILRFENSNTTYKFIKQ
ncbi:T9SS type A sorting domain-containing protein [Psychroserpens sp. Hel_I_66]|uniref:T9SS type A sorting domain-containing protein n=1 Tax=Psychroserpens sp. Hel_I_66 TaxID=1250004 RepID=UPI000647AAF3|nr:T9SS type A sorting domain-containing protein [Psychroserpens sp. Hel_I_66]